MTPLRTALLAATAVLATACHTEKTTAPSASTASTITRAPTENPPPPQATKNEEEDLAARKAKLTKEQYEVTQEDGTEPPFHNAYWDQHAPGIYVDVVSGEPLFSSIEKYESGTGWPSFYKPLDDGNIVDKNDSTLGMDRTEVRSKRANSHLGHVFEDGPPPTGLRYCINSAALRFVPAERLTIEGYGQYASRFPSVKQAAN